MFLHFVPEKFKCLKCDEQVLQKRIQYSLCWRQEGCAKVIWDVIDLCWKLSAWNCNWRMLGDSCCISFRLVLDLLQCSCAPQDFFCSSFMRKKEQSWKQDYVNQRFPKWNKLSHLHCVWTTGCRLVTLSWNESCFTLGLWAGRKPQYIADKFLITTDISPAYTEPKRYHISVKNVDFHLLNLAQQQRYSSVIICDQ